MTRTLSAALRRTLHAWLPRTLAALVLAAEPPDARAREEMALHIALETERRMAAGVPEVEARRQALAAFGGVTRYVEEVREGRQWSWAEAVARHVRHAARSLARTPRFAVTTSAVLALGLGVNAAVFALLSAALLRPLPFLEPDRLVVLVQAVEDAGRRGDRRWSYPEYLALRETITTVAPLAAVAAEDVNLSGHTEATRVRVETVSVPYFTVLGLQPRVGRFFDHDDDTAAGPRAVISHGLWSRRYGETASVVGEPLVLNGVAHTVVGVAPPGMDGITGGVDVWIPHAVAPLVTYGQHLTTSQHFLTIVGRLAPDQSIEGARVEVAAAGAAAAASVRTATGGPTAGLWTATAESLHAARRHPATTRLHGALSAVALLVLLLAVVDASSLLLTRTLGRRREFAIRAALGASRSQIAGPILLESCVVGLAGGLLGVGLAALLLWASTDTLAVLLHPAQSLPGLDLQAFAVPAIDWRVLAATAALSVVSGTAAGVASAWRVIGIGRGVELTSARGASEPSRARRAAWLPTVVVVQVAGAFALLVSAGSLLQALEGIVSRDMGVRSDGVVTFWISPPESRYGGDAAAPLLEHLLERVEAIGGVHAASVGRCAPLVSCSWTSIDRADAPGAGNPPLVGRHYVAPSHLTVLGIPLLRGRMLADTDRAGGPLVAVINASGARALWPGEDPVGKRVRFGSGGPFADPQGWTTIVGVVGDVPYTRSDQVGIDLYTSYRQFTWPETMVLVRTARDPMAVVPALRMALDAVDPSLSIHDVRTLDARTLDAVAHERFATTAVTSFAGLGVLLAALGVYGVLAHSVVRRRREVAIRLALGATRSSIVRLVTGRVLWLVLAGLLVGSAAALVMGRPLTLVMPEAVIMPPRILLFSATILVATAIGASLIPAWSAARTNPATTLAAE